MKRISGHHRVIIAVVLAAIGAFVWFQFEGRKPTGAAFPPAFSNGFVISNLRTI